MPARIASSAIPSARAAATAPAAFARLKLPRSFRSNGELVAAENAIASGSSAASRRPHASPTFTTAVSAWSKSARFAAK